MLIVADENIPYIREAAGTLGEVRTFSGRAIDAEAVGEAEVLFVRSVTQVNEALLAGSRVRFVGTATIGADHIDEAYLAREEIRFVSAPGSNATSVSEYVIAALLTLAERHGLTLADKTLAIIGVGNVGSRVVHKARALGLKILLCDPPRSERIRTGADDHVADVLPCRPEDFCLLEEALAAADIVTLHLPLTHEGADATHHLAGASFFAKLKPGAIFLNTSRGAVVDEGVLAAAMSEGRVARAVLDVWEREPAIDATLLARVDIGTPHIAGYSFDGKVNGTTMIVNAARQFLGHTDAWEATALLPEPETPRIELDILDQTPETLARAAVRAIYDIEADDVRLREMFAMPAEERPAAFDRLRKEYPRRREFHHTTVVLSAENTAAEAMLNGFGFRTTH